MPFDYGDVLAWKTTEPHRIFQHKEYFVHALRTPIKAAAQKYDLPPEIVGGTAFNEVGGADPVKPLVFDVRKLLDNLRAAVNPMSTLARSLLSVTYGGSNIYDYAYKTSLGPLSLQVRRAAVTLGYDPHKLSVAQEEAIVASLLDPYEAIFIAAKHLSELRDIEFKGKHAKDLDKAAIEIIGARYNKGPDVPISELKRDVKAIDYGKTIIRRWAQISSLLTEAPVSYRPGPSYRSKNLTQLRIEYLNTLMTTMY